MLKESTSIVPGLRYYTAYAYYKDTIWTQIMNQSSWTTTRIKRTKNKNILGRKKHNVKSIVLMIINYIKILNYSKL